jgi:hypothetical protein
MSYFRQTLRIMYEWTEKKNHDYGAVAKSQKFV